MRRSAARTVEQQQQQQRQLEEARAAERARQEKKEAQRREAKRLHEEAKAQQQHEAHDPQLEPGEVDVLAQFGYSSNSIGSNADTSSMCDVRQDAHPTNALKQNATSLGIDLFAQFDFNHPGVNEEGTKAQQRREAQDHP